MAIDYQKLDNWTRAKKTFSKIIGKDNYKHVDKKLKLFTPLDKLIKESDKAANKAYKILKKDKDGVPVDITQKLGSNNEEMTKEAKKLTKLLDKALDDIYDDPIEDLVGEIELYKAIYASFSKKRMTGKKEDLAAMKNIFKMTNKFLEPGSFETIFKKGENAMQEVARELRKFKAKGDQVTDDDINDLYKQYNDSLPGNKNGMRSITTFLKAFVDLEIYFEKYKISNTSFKKLKLHPEIKDYNTFRKYLKGATIFIRRLSPWATTSGNLITNSYINDKIEEGHEAISTDVGERILTAKREFIKAKTFFIKLF